MSTTKYENVTTLHTQNLEALVELQRSKFRAEGEVTYATRIDRLKRLKALIVENKIEFAKTTKREFGGARSYEFSLFSEFAGKVEGIDYSMKHLKEWMKPEKRKTNKPMNFLGGKSEVRHFPKGVVGIISPWNLPFGLTVAPLTSALAAGNRALLKPSEFVPETAALFADVVPKYFANDEVAVVTGGAEISQRFAELPFDHLLFTGSTNIGAKVMQSASKNLVPVTLELGGKSPVIIGRSAKLDLAGTRLTFGKLLNGGQLCLSPDYVVVPNELEEQLIARVVQEAQSMYPNITENEDYAGVINERHFARLQNYIDDAVAKGAKLTIVGADKTRASEDNRRMPLHILQSVNEDMLVMHEEIFGPILPVMTYSDVAEVPDMIEPRRNPLAMYYFGKDKSEQEYLLSNVQSGGVCINDITLHYVQEDLPFGGVGASGMGAYHGPEGFRTLSHARAIYSQTMIDVLPIIGARPPFGNKFRKNITKILGSI
ncbi:coniferyl aldehyde dehydrogenase [Porticoccaceae bacterium]|nr:coniferyl aldehyde dehydrogenase [Porticoccaceae bacterium]MDA8940956.1 coniferyl aldehyde dehydrogenase [Porticoccaceae bacterium]MDA9582940.1 coniferyl aldehyde dehydrogenase [Porticoccaceae bacterium]MDB2394888.1 coniferyl aldehyde dehydrogenase [Porticoccaceae bacterium]MDB2401108.1 coniferyl aldehyde dehydrogenase [Porticoccaceae bacterium]